MTSARWQEGVRALETGDALRLGRAVKQIQQGNMGMPVEIGYLYERLADLYRTKDPAALQDMTAAAHAHAIRRLVANDQTAMFGFCTTIAIAKLQYPLETPIETRATAALNVVCSLLRVYTASIDTIDVSQIHGLLSNQEPIPNSFWNLLWPVLVSLLLLRRLDECRVLLQQSEQIVHQSKEKQERKATLAYFNVLVCCQCGDLESSETYFEHLGFFSSEGSITNLQRYIWYQQGKYEACIDSCNHGSFADSFAFNLAGCCYAKLGQAKAASAHFKRALEMNNEASADTLILANIANHYSSIDPKASYELYSNMIQGSDPIVPPLSSPFTFQSTPTPVVSRHAILLSKGYLALQLHRSSEALSCFEEAQQTGGVPSLGYIGALLEANQYQNALRECELALDANMNTTAMLFKADALYHLHRYQEALDMCTHILASEQEGTCLDVKLRSHAIQLKVLCLVALGHVDEAACIQRALLTESCNDQSEAISYNLALLMWKQGSHESACAFWLRMRCISLTEAISYYTEEIKRRRQSAGRNQTLHYTIKLDLLMLAYWIRLLENKLIKMPFL